MKLDLTSDINKEYVVAMNYPRMDSFIVAAQWWLFSALAIQAFFASVVKVAAFYPSPFSWRVISHPEAIVAVILGFLAALVPTILNGKLKNHYAWRILITFTLAIFAYLFVFIGGGSIEMHFMFFVMITVLVVYSDWRLGWIMFVLVALHHGILNYTEPNWVYFYGRNDYAVISHALPVLMQVIFTTVLCRNQRKSVQGLLASKIELEATVQERTSQLQLAKGHLEEKVDSIKNQFEEAERLSAMMIDRELKMAELKQEIERLKKGALNQNSHA